MQGKNGLRKLMVGTPGSAGPNPARVYDFLLGGKNNFAPDRAAANRLIADKPELPANVRANRAFLVRAVRYLAMEAGIRQFLDIGTGLPSGDNTHEVAQAAVPECRIVYVDNDPTVLVHARALLVSTPQGTTDYLHADLRAPDTILAGAAATLDFSQPVAIMLLGILYLIEDSEDPYGIVANLMAAAVPGSYLAISHPASDIHPEGASKAAQRYAKLLHIRQTNRTRAEVLRFFDELDLVDPGVVQLNKWRPDPDDAEPEYEISSWAGVAWKPRSG